MENDLESIRLMLSKANGMECELILSIIGSVRIQSNISVDAAIGIAMWEWDIE